MKKYSIITGLAVIASGLFFNACNNEIPRGVEFTSYTYSSTDDDGGSWTPILLTSGADVMIDAPADVASSEYLAELAEVKSTSSSLTEEQQEIVDYWGNNPLIRWMEIAEELAAKYNLPPDPGPEGNYPPPTGPTADAPASPDFPFAHPPFTSRMYAYVSAAAYDATISSWHYKYLYNRPAIYQTDGSITQAYPANDIPSYPSDGAAITTTMQKILSALFPNDVAFLTEKAEECRNSRIWSGLACASDIAAGDSIGSYVASVYITRSKNDNAKFAQTDKPTYLGIVDSIEGVWGSQWTIWKNTDIPPRPVGVTPRYGNVTTWWVPDVATVRPGPPPAIGSPEYLEAEKEMIDLTKNVTKEQEKLAFEWSDGPATYTPAGHWNLIASEKMIGATLNPLRTARVYAYLNTAIGDATIACWDSKYYYFYPRPSQQVSEVKTAFMTPNFPSYLSGHSTMSGAAAEALTHFFPSDASEFDQMASDASNSRIYARIHWRFDCTTGIEVGSACAGYAISAAMTDGGE